MLAANIRRACLHPPLAADTPPADDAVVVAVMGLAHLPGVTRWLEQPPDPELPSDALPLSPPSPPPVPSQPSTPPAPPALPWTRSRGAARAPSPAMLLPSVGRREVLVSTTTALLAARNTSAAPQVAPVERAYPLITPLSIAVDDADDRDYGYLQLPNGLRVLLVSGSAERSELALTVRCGSLDCAEVEGLAHLAEHLTLAAGEGSGGALGNLIDELEGDLNAFTQEEATTFCCSWTADADGELDEPQAAVEEARALREVGRRFAAMFEPPPAGALEAVVVEELGRVDSEMVRAIELPGRSLLEIVQLKARSRPEAAWARLNRGDARTLPPARAAELVAGVRELRRRRYGARAATLSVVTPLPLAAAAAILGGAFGAMPSGPADVPVAGAAAAAAAALPFDAAGVPPAALVSPSRKRAALAVTWCVPVAASERAAVAQRKPLAILGRALSAPHEAGLAEALRARGLAPLSIELEPCVSTRTVVSTSRWVLWQLEVALRPEAVPRWAEALALVEHAVAGLALEGVPQHVAAEAQQRADDAYRSGSARLPSAIELSVSLQAEPSAPLALRAARAFVGPPAELAADATAAARLLASCKPVATLWTPTGPPGAATTAATGAAGVADAAWAALRIPLQRVPLPPADAAVAALPPLRAPPPNPYFLQGAAADVPRPLMEAVVERRSGVRVLQLPGCAEGGFRSFVDGIACAAPPGEVLGGGRERGDAARRAARGARRAPLLGAAVLQLTSSVPAAAAASTTQRARGELWRLSVTQVRVRPPAWGCSLCHSTMRVQHEYRRVAYGHVTCGCRRSPRRVPSPRAPGCGGSSPSTRRARGSPSRDGRAACRACSAARSRR